MSWTLGIDVAVRGAHQATLARDGKTVWRGGKFLTRPEELERVWADVGYACIGNARQHIVVDLDGDGQLVPSNRIPITSSSISPNTFGDGGQ